jgi:hypothetical protein
MIYTSIVSYPTTSVKFYVNWWLKCKIQYTNTENSGVIKIKTARMEKIHSTHKENKVTSLVVRHYIKKTKDVPL